MQSLVPVFLTGGMLECDLVHCNLWHYYVCCKRSGVTLCTHCMVIFLCRMCRCRLHVELWSHIGTTMRLHAVEPRSVTGLLFPFQYLCGTSLMTPYTMVWDWRVSRARQCFFIGLAACSLFLSSCVPFLFFYSVLVLWGWGLQIDRVLIAHSRPCITNLFL